MSSRAPPHTPKMAAVASITNPVSADEFFVFHNDNNSHLRVLKKFKSDLGEPTFDFSSASVPDVPSGNIANPSSLGVVLYDNMVNVYGVLNGTTAGDLLICRLSPGFEVLQIGEAPLANTSSIAVCSDGKSKGTLFYIVNDTDRGYRIKFVKLPGTSGTGEELRILGLKPTSYLGAAYGELPGKATNGYVAYQDEDNIVTPTAGKIVNRRGLPKTPIATLFVGNYLLVYFLGSVGSGTQPDFSPIFRAVTNDVQSFTVQILDQAQPPSGYTQLTAIASPSTRNDRLGTVILSYVEKDSNSIVSFEDDLASLAV
ncbi:hypothetical protein BDZ91DRAFT_761787 [Kalaharituber pfeilii]|nr:hypothetical protein BDZ91DRAFT_761787 [Kalaharituber pfeilii]